MLWGGDVCSLMPNRALGLGVYLAAPRVPSLLLRRQKGRVWAILFFLEAVAKVMVLVRPAEAAAVQNDTSDSANRAKGSLQVAGRLSEPCVLPVHTAEGAHGCRMEIVTPEPCQGVSAALDLLLDLWHQGKSRVMPESGSRWAHGSATGTTDAAVPNSNVILWGSLKREGNSWRRVKYSFSKFH